MLMSTHLCIRYSLCLLSFYLSAQVGIGTTNPSNQLHVVSSNDPIRVEGFQNELLSNINQANSTITTSEVLVCNALGVFKKVKPEHLDVEAYVSINEFLRSEPVIIPISGSFKGNVVYVVPEEYNGFVVESVTYRVMTTGDNFNVGLAKDQNGIETDLGLTGTIGVSHITTVFGGTVPVAAGEAIYITLNGNTTNSIPRGLSCTLRLIKP